MPTQKITAMSYNVWCNGSTQKQRANGVEQTIRSVMPDSVGLQEATDLWRDSMKLALGDAYGVACDQGRTGLNSEGMPVFYRKDKYELLDEGVFWLSDTPEVESKGWDGCCYRIAGWAVLRDKRSGFTYAHVNTHLDHIGPVAMVEGAKLVAERVKALNMPAVLTGDMNVKPGSPAMQALLAGGLTDLREAAPVTDGGVTFHNYDGEDQKIIDYVLVNEAIQEACEYKVIRDEYDGQYPSDHFAVAGTFVLGDTP